MKKLITLIVCAVGAYVATYAQPFDLKEGIYLSHHHLITNQVDYPIGELKLKYKDKRNGNIDVRKVTWLSPVGEQPLNSKHFYALVMGHSLFIQYGIDDTSITFGKQPETRDFVQFTPIHFRGQYGYVYFEQYVAPKPGQAITDQLTAQKIGDKWAVQKLYNIANGRFMDFSKPNVLRIIKDDEQLVAQLEKNYASDWRVLLDTLEQYEKRKQRKKKESTIVKL